LKQQIADKELKKQREIQEKRLDDEKEQQRIEREQIFLNEKYRREREEALKKEEEEKFEQERLRKEKRDRENLAEPPVQKLVMSKRGISPSNREAMTTRVKSPIPNVDPTPFRSSSPPLPAVLKRMKEQGLYTESAESTLHMSAQSIALEQPKTLPRIEESEEESENYSEDAKEIAEQKRIACPKVQIIIKEPFERKDSTSVDNLMILEQLSLIQKV
jgi:hypothetical protein